VDDIRVPCGNKINFAQPGGVFKVYIIDESAYAFRRGFQRVVEDTGRAARACHLLLATLKFIKSGHSVPASADPMSYRRNYGADTIVAC
jgi:hypothetical protein